jgi:hypothetical protein
MIANDSWPEPLRKRFGLPEMGNPVVQGIKYELFRNSRRYIDLILDASRGDEIDVEDLLAVAQRAGKPTAIINHDLNVAMAAYEAWRNSVNP